MPIIQCEILESVDAKLEKLCPYFLQGKRKTAQRVKWALECFLASKNDGNAGGEAGIVDDPIEPTIAS